MEIEKAEALLPAAEYVRMSTDLQKYSIENQSIVNHAYAVSRGMEIVRTYSDQGRSGLSLDGRDALKRLIDEVERGTADFKAILVYDVSRWGRFQDMDEGGHLEYVCKRAGISVCYCAEQFENDGSLISAIVKSIKRAMAGEYSRELSVKVFAGQARLARLGFKIGGPELYGWRRMLVDQAGKRKFTLANGERKSIQTDRVILVPGPSDEVNAVRWIFSTFVRKRQTEFEIAASLNKKGIKPNRARQWSYSTVRKILRSEIYIGNSTWNRTSIKLHSARVVNPREKWVRADGIIEPMIEPKLFDAAQAIFRERSRVCSEEEKLEPLRRLLRKRRVLTGKIISQSNEVASLSSYVKRFGSIRRVYKLIGYAGCRKSPARIRPVSTAASFRITNEAILNLLKGLLNKHGYLTTSIIDDSPGVPCSSTIIRRFGSLSRAYQLVGFPACANSAHGHLPACAMQGISSRFSNDQFLEVLRLLLAKRGTLTAKIIDRAKGVPSASAYCKRFGSLARAYQLIGYNPLKRSGLRLNRRCRG
jgi:DNA invertase Pin-like site-specific DNA recombinase